LQYLTFCNYTEKIEFIESIKDQILRVVHTKEGAQIGMLAVGYGRAKDRKILCKGLKGYINKIYTNENAYLYLLKILTTVDDTVLINTSILVELKNELYDVCTNKQGILLILAILCGINSKYFNPKLQQILAPTMIPSGEDPLVLVPSSKKDPEVRRKELYDFIIHPLIEMSIENAFDLMLTDMRILEVIISQAPTDLKEGILNKLIEIADAETITENEENVDNEIDDNNNMEIDDDAKEDIIKIKKRRRCKWY